MPADNNFQVIIWSWTSARATCHGVQDFQLQDSEIWPKGTKPPGYANQFLGG